MIFYRHLWEKRKFYFRQMFALKNCHAKLPQNTTEGYTFNFWIRSSSKVSDIITTHTRVSQKTLFFWFSSGDFFLCRNVMKSDRKKFERCWSLFDLPARPPRVQHIIKNRKNLSWMSRIYQSTRNSILISKMYNFICLSWIILELHRKNSIFWCIRGPGPKKVVFLNFFEKYPRKTYEIIHFWNQHQILRRLVYHARHFEKLQFFRFLICGGLLGGLAGGQMNSKISEIFSCHFLWNFCTEKKVSARKSKKVFFWDTQVCESVHLRLRITPRRTK